MSKRKLIIPKTDAEALLIEKAAAQGIGVGVRVRCPSCGDNYFSGKGHFGSDYCAVHMNLKREASQGNTVVNRQYKKLCRDANIKVHYGLGGFDATFDYKKYKNVSAETRMFAPRWVHNILELSREVRPRWRRVEVITATKDLLELKEELENLDHRDRHAIKAWLRRHLRKATKGGVDKIMRENIDDLIVELAKSILLRSTK